MNQAWQNFLEGRGARMQTGEPAHFGDPQGELAATQSGTILAPLAHFGLIRCSGEDAPNFLHNLLTNDVNHLQDGQAELNGFCSAKGRMLADFLMWRDGHDYFLRLSTDIQPAIQKKLGMYVLCLKVKLADAGSEFVLLGVAGREADSAVRAVANEVPAEPLRVERFGEGCLIRIDAQRFVLAVRNEAAEALWAKLSAAARPVGTDAWRWLDITTGISHITAPTQEEFVPQMVNFDLIGGVSFTKGCYPGQEVVARTKYLGRIKRRMYRIHVPGVACPQAGTDLFSADLPDQSCGKVVNAAAAPGGGCEALAVLIMASAVAGEVRLGAVDGPKVELRSLPYAME
jgi:folate-binding protein YgfZ